NSINPTVIGSRYSLQEIYLFYCWQEGTYDIYYSYYDVENFTGPQEPLWVAPYGGGGTTNNKPNITYQDGDYVDIGWQYWNGETGID
ncbi:MAG: hypothetical protein GWN14_08610, partial [candidate division Zixibacteria bacterium]|nr:hypothetical protein [Gammaproteobacteria bacterium]NIX55972.1 hypothetical protein [candidate division Zixibacteria bacterium]